MESATSTELCARVLADQPGAAEEFFEEFYPAVKRFLVARCSDGRSRNEAEEIAEDVLAACFREPGHRNPLRRYSGRIPLDQWLCKVAGNRLKNWWKSGRFTYERSGIGSDDTLPARSTAPGSAESLDADVYRLVSDALLSACRGINPRDLAIMRAYYLQGEKQSAIAKRWSCSPATIGRSLKRTVARIREGVEQFLAEQDLDDTITWEDLLQTIAIAPEILVGFDSRRE